MNEREKQDYLERYKAAKEKGVPFFPDVLFKDAVVSLAVFLVLAALAYFFGAALEERANPADTNYNPRPEWYFLFLFQMLKYFPGKLEFIGVVVIPTVSITLLFLLPFLDRSARRHALKRPAVTVTVVLLAISFIGLSYLSIKEIPPPAVAAQGDQTALLYSENCAPCHGPSIAVPSGTSLHTLIAQGKHEGMPPWSADLTSDEIDALAGFVLSPGGNSLFVANCGSCHDVAELVAVNPLELKEALSAGPEYPAHQDVDVPVWTEELDQASRTSLVNFLVAPDGQRLFATNCSSCHGRAVGFTGTEAELRTLIGQGGSHLEMPPWRDTLNPEELDTLAQYIVDPQPASAGAPLFIQYCAACHGDRVPAAEDVSQARETIASGGAHETMPVWGEILTTEQLDALVKYTQAQASGAPIEVGRDLFAKLCTPCHGDFGEGGANPSRPGDIIAPISTSEYLSTRDDATLRAIIATGQPDFGMSPFGSANGGPLDDDDIDAIVAFIRSWADDPPVELPPEVAGTVGAPVAVSGPELYDSICAQCHGPDGAGGVGPSLSTAEFQASITDDELYDTISQGHGSTSMIAWGDFLPADQIRKLVSVIRTMGPEQAGTEAAAGPVSFAADVLPILNAQCKACHGAFGGWDGATYEAVINSGDHGPAVTSGDVEGSLLAQKILGTQAQGGIMPPSGKMDGAQVQLILDWIAAGAPDN